MTFEATIRPSMRTPQQASLFSIETPQGDARGLAVAVVAPTAGPLTRQQREFNTLSASVEQLRQRLVDTEALRQDYQSHVAKMFEPAWRKLLSARRDWAIAADAVLQGQSRLPKTQRLSRRRHEHLAAFVVSMVDDLLDEMDDKDLVTIHDRYSELTVEEMQALDVDFAQSLMQGLVGEEAMQGDAIHDVESALRKMQAQLEAQAQAGTQRRRSQTHGHESKAAAKLAQAKAQASQSIRDVYRKLASSLHPDREPDPDVRTRKTHWMQQVNKAYADGDLQQLLSLQMSLLQADRASLTQASDAHLKLFCQVLKEQQQSLRAQVAAAEAPIRHAMHLGPRGPMPELGTLVAHVSQEAKEVKRGAAELLKDIPVLQNVKLCPALIDTLVLIDDEPDWDDIESMLAGEAQRLPKRPRRRN